MNIEIKRILSILFIFLNITLLSLGQPVTVNVRDTENKALIGATVQLIKVNDSTMRSGITNREGAIRFDKIKNTLYNINIRYLGFLPIEKSIIIRPDQREFTFRMEEDAIALGGVTVTAKRPLIYQEDDKTIIDPEPLAQSSTNTLEILEATPGLFVDQDGGIFLNSATPAAIYINGREQKMSNQDLMTILRALPPGSVQRIEVLRSPSSKYDASSSGGIINIVLKKGVKLGRYGSISIGMNQGVYGNRFLGFSMNGSGDKSSRYLNVNINRNGVVEDFNTDRFLARDTLLGQSARNHSKNDQGYLGYGLNYNANKLLSLTYDGRINASIRRSESTTQNSIKDAVEFLLYKAENEVDNRVEFLNIQQDFGVNYKLDSIGSEWDTKFSYTYNHNDATQAYQTQFLLPAGNLLKGDGDNLQVRHFLIFQSDLTYNFHHKLKIESGIKASHQDYESRANYWIDVAGTSQKDSLRTNEFEYQEQIFAAYAQASHPLPQKILLKAGVRMEQTKMSGRQILPGDTSFIVNRTDFFPYVYLSRPILNIADFELRGFLIYRKTINRPVYQNLNPYIRYIDPFLYEMGNPALKPQFTDNIEANLSFNEYPIFAIGQNFTRNVFSNVVYQDPVYNNVAVRTFDNLGKNKETYFQLAAAIPPGGKYFFVIGTQYNLTEYEGIYENKPFIFNKDGWRFFTFHSFNISKDTKLNMFAFLMHKGHQNFYELNTFGQLNFTLNQSLMDKKLNISLSARDVLRTMVPQFTLNQGSMQVIGDRYIDNQRFGINIRYSFGIGKKEEQPNMMRFEPEE